MRDRIFRLFRHRWARETRDVLPAATLQALQDRVTRSELLHTGEIRVSIEAGLPNSYLLRPDPTTALLKQRAIAMFGRLRVWDTTHNNGVLIYMCLAERSIELLADRGVNAVVDQDEWSRIVHKLGEALAAGQFAKGLTSAIAEVDSLLTEHFPASADAMNPDELPNSPVLM